jgi:hypothetical protein
MARKYSIDGQATNDADDTILALISATTIKPKIYDLILGSDATPADNAAEYNLQRFTAEGTSTSVTPRPLDPDDPAALASAGENHTVEPTYTADLIMLQWAQNQRATFRWVAAPGGEIILPATANNGVGVRVVTVAGSAVNTNCVIHYEE